MIILQPIHEVVQRDEEIKKIQTQISAGMQTNATNLQNYLATWDNYREIWEINKDAFIRRYQKLNPQVSSFDADIARFDTLQIHNIFVIIICHLLGHSFYYGNSYTKIHAIFMPICTENGFCFLHCDWLDLIPLSITSLLSFKILTD